MYDKNSDISAEGIGKKLEKIFNDNIKKDSYIKIKSGIFSTKMELDSILRENEDAKIKVEKRKAEGDSNFHQQIENQIAYLYEQLESPSAFLFSTFILASSFSRKIE